MKKRRSNKFAKAFCFCRRKCFAFCQIICSPPFLHTPNSHYEVQKANFLILLTHVRTPFYYCVVLPTTVLLYWLFVSSITHIAKFFENFFIGYEESGRRIKRSSAAQNIFIMKKITPTSTYSAGRGIYATAVSSAFRSIVFSFTNLSFSGIHFIVKHLLCPRSSITA